MVPRSRQTSKIIAHTQSVGSMNVHASMDGDLEGDASASGKRRKPRASRLSRMDLELHGSFYEGSATMVPYGTVGGEGLMVRALLSANNQDRFS